MHLLLQVQHRPETAVADALHGILIADMRKHAGDHAALIDRAIAGDDITSSIAAVCLADDDMPDDSGFPVWPGRTLP